MKNILILLVLLLSFSLVSAIPLELHLIQSSSNVDINLNSIQLTSNHVNSLLTVKENKLDGIIRVFPERNTPEGSFSLFEVQTYGRGNNNIIQDSLGNYIIWGSQRVNFVSYNNILPNSQRAILDYTIFMDRNIMYSTLRFPDGNVIWWISDIQFSRT